MLGSFLFTVILVTVPRLTGSTFPRNVARMVVNALLTDFPPFLCDYDKLRKRQMTWQKKVNKRELMGIFSANRA